MLTVIEVLHTMASALYVIIEYHEVSRQIKGESTECNERSTQHHESNSQFNGNKGNIFVFNVSF